MTAVLNEIEWAKNAISKCELGRHPFETLCRVAKYYLVEDDGNRQAARCRLETFLLRCNPTASVVLWGDTLDKAVKCAAKNKAVELEYIPVTDKEMYTIHSLKGAQLQRLALVLLCLSKYWDVVSGVNTHWVNSKDNEIMKIANINTSIRRQCLMYNQLYEAGLIRFSKKIDNTNVQVCFAEDGEVVMKVTGFDNLGYQYKLFMGDDAYFRCQECGLVVRRENLTKEGLTSRGRPQIYCRNCAMALRVRRNVDSVMKDNAGTPRVVCKTPV